MEERDDDDDDDEIDRDLTTATFPLLPPFIPPLLSLYLPHTPIPSHTSASNTPSYQGTMLTVTSKLGTLTILPRANNLK